MNYDLIAVILNSTIRSTTPVLLAALGSAICSQVGIFNIALEGQLLLGSFVAIVVNHFTGSVYLATLAGISAGAIIAGLVAILQVKYKAADMVVGTSINLLVSAVTAILLSTIFGVKGSYSGPELVALPKINLPIIKSIPYISTVLANLTLLDYLTYAIAWLIFIYLYKTAQGFHVQSVGQNIKAANSLGIKSLQIQIRTIIISGALCGLGGAVLSMGQVILFTENMTAGRGYIAMAAASMGINQPILVVASSLFFGLFQAVGSSLQNFIPSQFTLTIPYIGTVIALAYFGYRAKQKRRKSR